MYAKKPELPIDPCNFLGLRFRIHYRSYTPEEPVKKRRRDLGTPSKSYRGNCFYWDVENDDDPTIREAMWQHSLWSNWPNQICIPENYTEPHLKPKEALLKLLRTSGARRPMPLLYFYCKCDFPESRNQPVLRFANNNDAANLVSHLDLFQSEFVDSPLVFMNACITSASDPYYANELQAFFIRRGCSAYLGTEAEVPVHLGSCFAVIFFHFFYRKMKDWPEPISAGEAMAQARLFLWTQYKNIGGLLYTYINQSQLFMADAVELEKLRNTPTRMMDYPYIQRPLD
jgi:hypothetical protein